MRRRKLSEAATKKAQARRAIRTLDELLGDKTLPEDVHSKVTELRGLLKKTWKELEGMAAQGAGRRGVAQAETALSSYQNNSIGEAMAKTKTVNGKSVPAGSFLVVEDPASPSSWHLQVKDENGEIDHRLMGAAFAALTKGYRGNKYEGPEKAKALTALKALYKAEGMDLPADNAESEAVAEYEYDGARPAFVSPNITSFAQLRAAQAASEIACDMRESVEQFQQMLTNIFFWSSVEAVPDKIAAAQALFDEFIGVVDMILTGGEEGEEQDGAGLAGAAEAEADPAETLPLSESDGAPVRVVEAEGAATNPRGPLELDVQLIRPGWGNQRDNHYYPADMLKRDAHVFEGAKMYSTDHRQDEKSVRTEVSKIQRITGFTEQGAPIGRVVVFDPDFAESIRNRAQAGVLDSLECSILADGRARPGFEEGGRKGKIVEAITAVSSVDWVTRAGAGGRALALAESAAEPDEPQAAPIEDAQEADLTESVSIRESTGEEAPAVEEPQAAPEIEPDPAPAETPVDDVPVTEPEPESTPESEPPAPAALSPEAVREALAETNLPGKSVLALLAGQYADEAALSGAVQAEIKRIKELSGSGRPFAMGETAPVTSRRPASRAEIEEVMDQVNSRFGIGR